MKFARPPVRHHMQRHSGEAGFTIVELLVSLVILGVILSFLPGTLRVGKRVWEIQANIEQVSAHSAFHHYVEQRLSAAMPVFSRDQDGKIQVSFRGGPKSVRFVARAPAGPAGGGVYQFEFSQSRTGARRGVALVLKTRIYRLLDSEALEKQTAVHTVPGRIGKLRLRYFGKTERDGAAQWQTHWPRRDVLPDLVEINVTTAGPRPVVTRRIVELKLRARR